MPFDELKTLTWAWQEEDPGDVPLEIIPDLTKPDLSTPTLRGLAWLLRHPEAWPRNHTWDFGFVLARFDVNGVTSLGPETDCGTVGCAWGIAKLQWPHLEDEDEARMADGGRFDGGRFIPHAAKTLGITEGEVCAIFTAGGGEPEKVTPEMVADRIDALLASKADRHCG